MAQNPSYPPAQLPARELPTPSTVSPQAQAILNMLSKRPEMPSFNPGNLDAWRAVQASRQTPEAAYAIALATTGSVDTGAATETREIALSYSTVYVGVPEELSSADGRVYFAIHGGGFTDGGGLAARLSAGLVAGSHGITTWTIDYRLLPDHPFPAGLDDCVEAYRLLLETHDPASIIIGGQSAGGNLAASVLLRAQMEGLPLPAGLVLNCPGVDLTMSGDSLSVNDFGNGSDFSGALALYAGSADPSDPLLSPLYGEFAADWPPTLLVTGTRDFLLSDTVRMHRALLDAGVDAELHVFEAAVHGIFAGQAPEDHAVVAQVRRFFDRAFTGRRR
ncbi:alpha/beta hydrolase [Arthrobacter sp. efr-133-TYG-118]|uniref:alpha/beta hydrolase n=1 Tax=Arthrobacter sp. efr-133-TYG-118 TaxID=3040279 RepID=UPI00254DE0B5|nr:alpha/beta hydrolase [Arthrobacter sp. efr-133-TYG-118]